MDQQMWVSERFQQIRHCVPAPVPAPVVLAPAMRADKLSGSRILA
jgi:hypothetical protein